MTRNVSSSNYEVTEILKVTINANSLQYKPMILTLMRDNQERNYEGWNFDNGNYLFTTDTKQIHVSKFYCPSM